MARQATAALSRVGGGLGPGQSPTKGRLECVRGVKRPLERSVSSLCGGCDNSVDMEGCGKEKDLHQCVCLWTLSVL